VVLAVVLVGVCPQVWLWWWQTGRRRRWVPLPVIASAVALLMVPASAAYWVWHQSGHLGTAGEPTPDKAAAEFMDELMPPVGTIPPVISRLYCTSDPRAKRDLARFVHGWDTWERHLARSRTTMTALWIAGHVTRHGDRATVPGTVETSQTTTVEEDGQTRQVTMSANYEWTFHLVKEDGWRVCEITGPGFSTHDPAPSTSASATPTPAPDPTPSASPSPTGSGLDPDIPQPPPDMDRCGKNDPYRSMGWYTCPPD
jgi:hypothetical protein